MSSIGDTPDWSVRTVPGDAVAGDPTVPYGVNAMGSDGVDEQIIATDTNGRQVPLVATLTSRVVNIHGVGVTVISYSGSHAYHLFKCSVSAPSGAASLVTITTNGGEEIAVFWHDPAVTCVVDLAGFAAYDDVQGTSTDTNTQVVITYAIGP